MDIRGGSLERGRQMRVGSSKMAIFASFACYIFQTFIFKATILLYCTRFPISGSSVTSNRWPWMILNGHFALKCDSGSAFNGFVVLAFGENCSEICRATHNTVSGKNVTQGLYWWRKCYGVFHWGSRRGSVKPVLYSVFTLISHTCCSLMSVENK